MGSDFVLLPLALNLNPHFSREKQTLSRHWSIAFNYTMNLEN